jgi:hypothetical protein
MILKWLTEPAGCHQTCLTRAAILSAKRARRSARMAHDLEAGELDVADRHYRSHQRRHRSVGPVGRRLGVLGVKPRLECRTGKGGLQVWQQAAVLPDLVVGVVRVGDALDPQ